MKTFADYLEAITNKTSSIDDKIYHTIEDKESFLSHSTISSDEDGVEINFVYKISLIDIKELLKFFATTLNGVSYKPNNVDQMSENDIKKHFIQYVKDELTTSILSSIKKWYSDDYGGIKKPKYNYEYDVNLKKGELSVSVGIV